MSMINCLKINPNYVNTDKPIKLNIAHPILVLVFEEYFYSLSSNAKTTQRTNTKNIVASGTAF